MSHFTYMKKYLKEPLITLTIEIDRDKFAQIHIHEDSNPELLAEQFIGQHRLNNSYKEPLRQNIIQQMLLYDKMKDTPKEIVKEPQPISYKKVPNKENQFSTPKRQRKSTEKLITQIKAQNKPQVRQKTSKSPQKLILKSPRLNQLCKNKSFEFMPLPKAEVKISILENEESVTQLPKESPNVSFSEESQFQNDNTYTSDQVENSLQNLLKDNDNRIITKLFNIMQTDKYIDPRNIPYEKFNYQLIVEIRKHFAKNQFRIMDQKDFTETAKKNHILIKCAADFFQL
ncbi:hypothetical protein pb186bvf_000529 [Paramecium bursaria]